MPAVRFLLGLLAFLALAFAGLWFFRIPVAEWGAERLLERQGLGGAVEIAQLDLREARLHQVSLAGAEARGITLRYDPLELLSGRVDFLEVDGLEAELPLNFPPRDQADADPQGEPATDLEPLFRYLPERVLLRQARLLWPESPLGAVVFTGRLESERAASGHHLLAGYISARADRGRGELRFDGLLGEAGPRNLNAEANLALDEGALGGGLKASFAGGAESDRLRLDIGFGGGLPELMALLPPDGTANLEATAGEVAGTLAATVQSPSGFWSGVSALLQGLISAATAEGTAEIRVNGADLLGQAEDLSLETTVDFTAAAEETTLWLGEPARISAAGLDRGWLAALGLPEDLAAAFADGVEGAVAAAEDMPFLKLGSEGGKSTIFTAHPQVTLRALSGGSLEIAAAPLAGRMNSAFDLEELFIEGLAISARDLALAGVTFPEVQVAGGGSWTDGEGSGELRAQGRVLRAEEGGRLRFDLPLTLSGTREALTLRPESAGSLQVEGLAVEGLRLTGPEGALLVRGEGVEGTLAATLSQEAAEPLFYPLVLSFTGHVQDGTARGEATVRHQEQTLARARLSHDLPLGAGSAEITLGPFDFDPEGFQPAEVLPLADSLRQVSGDLSGEARLSWTNRGLEDSSGSLKAEDLGFAYDLLRVDGLEGEVSLVSLWPLRSRGRERLTARRINMGLSLEDLESFAVVVTPAEAQAPRLKIEEARANLLGGRLHLAEPLTFPLGEEAATAIGVSRLNLEDLSALLGSEQVELTGKVSGTLPLLFHDGGMISAGGNLTNAGPGRIRIRSDEARQALSAAGEAGTLMLDALEDFRYQRLDIAFQEVGPETTRLNLMLEGSNPEVMEDQPFIFNISLETQLLPILAALREAGRLSDDVLERLLRITD